MKILQSEQKLCFGCMEEHQVDVVEVEEKTIFKDIEVDFVAVYEYCSNTDTLLETEEIMQANDLAVKDAYRRKVGLLTSEDIKKIREAYKMSQKDFSEVLDWGKATITRYENYQVQDRVHDDVLRKINDDPKWFLDKINNAKERLSPKAFAKYYQEAKKQYSWHKDQYLVDAIHAIYAYFDEHELSGRLDLEKIIEAINYFAARVENLHKVKLMKMLWYADALHYKRHERSITGLVYSALPLGAVPEGYEEIILLEGVHFDTVLYDDVAYRFKPAPDFEVQSLTDQEIGSLERVIEELGSLNTTQVVKKMHKETAYQNTGKNQVISYDLAKTLSID